MSKDAPSKRAGGVVHQAQPDERVQYNAPRLTCYGTLTELTRAQGLPLVVVLSSRGNGSGETSLWIDDVVAVGWGPQVSKPGPDS